MSEELRRELEQLWTPKKVADYLGMSVVTIYRWISEKKVLNPDKIIHLSNRVRIPRSEVERIAGSVRERLEE